MSSKGRFYTMLKNDPRFLKQNLEIQGKYLLNQDVQPEHARLRSKNIVAAYQAVGRPMDKHRFSRMMRAYDASARGGGIGNMRVAGTLCQVLSEVYGIDIDPKEVIA
jgi:hypothetical protein